MPNDDAGFSLIELVIAMTIISLVLVGMVQGVRGSLASVSAAGRTAEAAQVLAGRWAELERTGIAEGSGEEELDGGWHWQYTVSRSADPRLYQVEMHLLWTEGGRQRQVSLDALAPAPPEE